MWDKLVEDVTEVINNDGYVNLVLNKRINQIDEENKKLYTKVLYGVVENKKWLDYLLRPYITGKRVKANLKNTLRIGVYVISFLNVANHYIVNELVNITKKKDYNASKFINSVLRNYVKDNRFKEANDSLNKLDINEAESIIYNIDKDVLMLIKKDYPKEYKQILQTESNTYNTYRINFLKGTSSDVISYLENNKIDYELKEEVLITKTSLINTKLFNDALIIPQDYSSIMVAKTLNPLINSKVLDTCAAPGSKSFHLAMLMKNTGSIISCDIYSHKLELIKEEAKREGITCIKTRLLDASNCDYEDTFKYVLVDAPCSGMGTMKHKGDIKLRLSISKLKEIEDLQMRILDNVEKYVESKGILVYSTCTINKGENEAQIQNFLLNHSNYHILEEKMILPTNKNDGFYICKLEKE